MRGAGQRGQMADYNSTFLDLVATPLLWLSEDGKVALGLNAAANRVFAAGRPPVSIEALFGEATATAIRSRVADAGRPRPLVLDVDAVTPTGAVRLRLTVEAAPGDRAGWLVGVEDCSPPVVDGSADEAWRATLLQVLDQLPVGLEIYDDAYIELFSNLESTVMFGYTTQEIRGLDAWWEIGYPDPNYRVDVQRAWEAAIAQSRRTQSDVLLRDLVVTCKDGSRKIVQPRYRAIGEQHVLVYWDMTGRRRLERELRQAAETDVLTGVCDRRRFFVEAAAMLADSAATGRPLSLLMLDVDHFKSINDRFGHAGGDEVLRTVARRFVEVVRVEDLVARLGGEEFAVLLPGLDGAAAKVVADRVRAALSSRPIEVAGGRLTVRTSVGGASRTDAHETVDQLLERADRALYAAKRDGRDRVVFADAAT
jgi:diguanylate cyclase (GGDEF)-like protein